MRAILTSCLLLLCCLGCERHAARTPGDKAKFPDAVLTIFDKTVADDVYSTPLAGPGRTYGGANIIRNSNSIPFSRNVKWRYFGTDEIGDVYEFVIDLNLIVRPPEPPRQPEHFLGPCRRRPRDL